MPTINEENARSIRDSMQVYVTVWKRYNQPGYTDTAYFEFTNENLISCELNLRSDLNPIDPSLPESEIVVQAYWPTDVSEQVLTIADDTIITYQAGYDNDLSPVRMFYLSEKIEWVDKILTVKGVDAVHFMNGETFPFLIGNHYAQGNNTGAIYYQTFNGSVSPRRMLFNAFCDLVKRSGVSLVSAPPSQSSELSISASLCAGVIERQSYRDAVANLMNLCHTADDIWYTYVDAGRPIITKQKPASSWTINEVDCGDISTHIDKKILKIIANVKRLDVSGAESTWTSSTKEYKECQKVGSAEIFQSKGAGFKFDTLASIVFFVAQRSDIPSGQTDRWVSSLANPNGHNLDYGTNETEQLYYQYDSDSSSVHYGKVLLDDKEASWQAWGSSGAPSGTPPNNRSVASFYSTMNTEGFLQDIQSRESVTVDLCGGAFNLYDAPKSYTTTGQGVTVEPKKTLFSGSISINTNGTTSVLLPDAGYKALLNRSNKTGSFTWKGDPRMQPRDVFTFVYKDGTTEERTIESINLKHEGGGTVATITYRKGIV